LSEFFKVVLLFVFALNKATLLSWIYTGSIQRIQ